MAHPLLERAAKHNAQARAINDEFEGKEMPAEAFRQMSGHLEKATELRRRHEREEQLKDNERYLSEPQYKHSPTDFGGNGGELGSTGAGEFLLDSEKQQRAKNAFFDYIRKGTVSPEAKAALVEDATGEKIVPADVVGIIRDALQTTGVFRQIAWVRPTSSNRVDLSTINIGDPTWGKLELGDSAGDGLGNPPVAGPQEIRVWDLNALVKLGVDELEDTNENIEAIIKDALSDKFRQAEDLAFAAGTGDANKQPSGVSASTAVTQKVTAAAAGTVTGDDVIKLQYAVLNDGYREAGVYVGSASMEMAVRLLKDGNGTYMWQERFRDGLPPLLNGRPWYCAGGFPAFTADATASKSLYYGDFKRGYMVADRRQMVVTRLNELFAAEGKVGLLFRHRVGGDVVRPKALAYLEV
ncbi:phage major capsid protein [Naumannella sp. ID2617S]|nr:phage major capsid protein [Naumannella sp. ID2617S]